MSKHSMPKAAPFDPSARRIFSPSQLRQLQLDRLKRWSRKPSTTSPFSAAPERAEPET